MEVTFGDAKITTGSFSDLQEVCLSQELLGKTVCCLCLCFTRQQVQALLASVGGV